MAVRKKLVWLAAVIFGIVFVLGGCGNQAIQEARVAVEAGETIDFAKLQNANSDIFGWLCIPGTGISEPMMIRDGNDVYYLTHDSSGGKNDDGAIHIQPTYNHSDMEDPVTVLFGSAPESGELFGELQVMYSKAEELETHGKVTVYLPDKKLDYEVFAAVPASNAHILYNYDFSDPETYQLFLDRIMGIRALGANFNKDINVSTDDKILILDTSLKGSTEKRYLVLAKRL